MPRLARIRTGFLTLALTLIACDKQESSQPSAPGATNAVGRLTLDGAAAAGAVVRAYACDYLPEPENAFAKAGADRPVAFAVKADAEGGYTFPDLPAGCYDIIAALADKSVKLDSVFLPAASLPDGELGRTGAVEGRVALQPLDDPRGFLVQAIGTPFRVYLGKDGSFSLEGLPAGHYRLRVSGPGTSYRSAIVPVDVAAGGTEAIADKIEPLFLGLPVVAGLRIEQDTAAGIVRVYWHRSASPLVDHYVVERIDQDASANPWGASLTVADTVFSDTLFPKMRRPDSSAFPDTFGADRPARHLSYRVAASAKTDAMGPFLDKLEWTALPPDSVETRIAFGTLRLGSVFVPVGGKGRVAVSFSNPRRGLTSLEWLDSAGRSLRKRPLSGRNGEDTLDFDAPSQAGYSRIRIRISDASKDAWEDSVGVFAVTWKRLEDRPVPAYDNSGEYLISTPLIPVGGRIYALGGSGSVAHSAGTVFDPASGKWSRIAPAPALGPASVANGKIYMEANDSIYVYDPDRDAWTGALPVPKWYSYYYPSSISVSFAALGGKAIFSRNYDRSSYLMDLADGSSRPMDALIGNVETRFPFATGKGLYQFEGRQVYKVDTISAAFTYVGLAPITPQYAAEAEMDGVHYFARYFDVTAFDTEKETWASFPGPGLNPKDGNHAIDCQAANGRLYAFESVAEGLVDVRVFAPRTGKWSYMTTMAIEGNRFRTASADGKLYLLSYYGKGSPQEGDAPAFYELPSLP